MFTMQRYEKGVPLEGTPYKYLIIIFIFYLFL